MFKISDATMAVLPVSPTWVTESDTAFTQLSLSQPKIRRHAGFPGVCFRICSSFSELQATCTGFAFHTKHSTYAAFPVICQGDAIDDIFLRSHTPGSLYGGDRIPGQIVMTGGSNLESMISSETNAGCPTSRTEVGVISKTLAIGVVPEGVHSLNPTKFIGVISDATWAYGQAVGAGGNPANWPTCGFTFVKRLPLASVGALMRDVVIPDLLAGAGDAAEYVGKACDDYLALPFDNEVFSVPFKATIYHDYPYVAGTNGHATSVREQIGFPTMQPLPVFGNKAEDISSTCYWMHPRQGAVWPDLSLTFTPQDEVGRQAFGDILNGMLYLREVTDTGPVNTQPLFGLSMSSAVEKALQSVERLTTETLAPGTGASAPVVTNAGVITNPGSISGIGRMPTLLKDTLDGPCGYHGYVKIVNTVQDILKAAQGYAS